MLSHGPVSTKFDFESPGKRSGFIDVSHSNNGLAFSVIRVPVGVICGTKGPTVLLTAGNHGDEYEGQMILHKLMQELDPDDIHGRLIMLPALNQPAVRARTRVSPLDAGNMNRSFPGDPKNGPTGAIAAFVTAHLIPMADVIVDFHSGGTATHYVDSGFLYFGSDDGLNAANLDLAEVFGAPFTMVCHASSVGGDFDSAAHTLRTRFLSCELGGSGGFSPSSFDIGWRGIWRILAREGILTVTTDATKTRFIDVGKDCEHVTADHHALAEIHVLPGDQVSKGDVVATLFDPHNFGEVLGNLCAGIDGWVAVRRRNPFVDPGDHLCMICPEVPRAKLL